MSDLGCPPPSHFSLQPSPRPLQFLDTEFLKKQRRRSEIRLLEMVHRLFRVLSQFKEPLEKTCVGSLICALHAPLQPHPTALSEREHSHTSASPAQFLLNRLHLAVHPANPSAHRRPRTAPPVLCERSGCSIFDQLLEMDILSPARQAEALSHPALRFPTIPEVHEGSENGSIHESMGNAGSLHSSPQAERRGLPHGGNGGGGVSMAVGSGGGGATDAEERVCGDAREARSAAR